MALKTSVVDGDAIIVNGDGGATRSWWVTDPFGFSTKWREKHDQITKRWVGLTYTAARTYYDAHLADSTLTTQVGVRFSCDNINLKSYTVERVEDTITIEQVT